MAENSSMSGGMASGSIDSLASSVKNSLTSMDPKAGASAISQVQSMLKSLPGTSAISDSLSSLHQQLTSGSPDGARVGQLLTQVSDQTRSVSSQAGPLSGTLSQLADGLATVGAKLSSGGSSGMA